MAVIIPFPAPGSEEHRAIRQRCRPSSSFVDLHRSAFALVQMLGHDAVIDTLLDVAEAIENDRTTGG